MNELAESAKNAKMYERIVTIPIVTRAYVGRLDCE